LSRGSSVALRLEDLGQGRKGILDHLVDRGFVQRQLICGRAYAFANDLPAVFSRQGIELGQQHFSLDELADQLAAAAFDLRRDHLALFAFHNAQTITPASAATLPPIRRSMVGESSEVDAGDGSSAVSGRIMRGDPWLMAGSRAYPQPGVRGQPVARRRPRAGLTEIVRAISAARCLRPGWRPAGLQVQRRLGQAETRVSSVHPAFCGSLLTNAHDHAK
jgi:hypothetical protein